MSGRRNNSLEGTDAHNYLQYYYTLQSASSEIYVLYACYFYLHTVRLQIVMIKHEEAGV